MRPGLGPIAVGLALASAAVDAAPAVLAFDQVFATRGEPAQLHSVVLFRSGGGTHRMEMWRDGDRRLLRVTDARIATYAMHQPGDPGYRLAVLDLNRRIRTDIDRTNLYRIGNFANWFDLGHGLRHPVTRYRLTAAAAPALPVKPVAACRWYALAEGKRTTDICWDGATRMPLMMTVDGRPVWRVVSLDRTPIPAARFAIRDAGFVRYDANQDMDRD